MNKELHETLILNPNMPFKLAHHRPMLNCTRIVVPLQILVVSRDKMRFSLIRSRPPVVFWRCPWNILECEDQKIATQICWL